MTFSVFCHFNMFELYRRCLWSDGRCWSHALVPSPSQSNVLPRQKTFLFLPKTQFQSNDVWLRHVYFIFTGRSRGSVYIRWDSFIDPQQQDESGGGSGTTSGGSDVYPGTRCGITQRSSFKSVLTFLLQIYRLDNKDTGQKCKWSSGCLKQRLSVSSAMFLCQNKRRETDEWFQKTSCSFSWYEKQTKKKNTVMVL